MKHIRIVLEDDEYELLRKLKGNRSWREFLMELGHNLDTSSTFNEVEIISVLENLYKLNSIELHTLGKSLRRYNKKYYLAAKLLALISGLAEIEVNESDIKYLKEFLETLASSTQEVRR